MRIHAAVRFDAGVAQCAWTMPAGYDLRHRSSRSGFKATAAHELISQSFQKAKIERGGAALHRGVLCAARCTYYTAARPPFPELAHSFT